VNEESGFDPNATSPTGAEGMFQFEPSTYNAVAAAAGVQPGTEYNPNDEEKAYGAYMKELLQEEGGSIYKALEAYNAGPGDLSAGSGYASTILSNANESASATASGGTAGTGGGGTGTPVQTGLDWNPLNLFGIPTIIGQAENSTYQAAENAAGDVISDVFNAAWQSFMNVTGISGFKDFMIRVGLILLGFTIFIVGLVKLIDINPVANAVDVGKTAAKDTAFGSIIL
jgi:hypothetical protein